MSGPLWFDIQNFTPHRGMTDLPERPQRTYRNINLLIHLLDEVPYSIVHGDLAELLDRAKENIGRPDWPDAFADVGGLIGGTIEAIEESGAATGAQVSDFFTRPLVESADAAYPVIGMMAAALDALPSFNLDARIPFIDAQLRGRFVEPAAFAQHSGAIHHLTLKRLYLMPTRKMDASLAESMQFLHEAGVLSGKEANGLKCNQYGTGCETAIDPNCFCSTDSAGNCSAMTTC